VELPCRRELPASARAALNVGHASTTGASGVAPGSTVELPGRMVTRPPNVSLPVNCCRTRAPAPLNVL
jgi:hypothetical protein